MLPGVEVFEHGFVFPCRDAGQLPEVFVVEDDAHAKPIAIAADRLVVIAIGIDVAIAVGGYPVPHLNCAISHACRMIEMSNFFAHST